LVIDAITAAVLIEDPEVSEKIKDALSNQRGGCDYGRDPLNLLRRNDMVETISKEDLRRAMGLPAKMTITGVNLIGDGVTIEYVELRDMRCSRFKSIYSSN